MLSSLPRITREAPDIDVRIAASLDQIDANSAELGVRDSFRSGEINVAIRFGWGVYPGCRVDPLFRVAATPLCRPALLSGDRPLRTPRDLKLHTLLHDDTPTEGRPDWETWLSAAGVKGLAVNRGPHFNSVQLALQAATEGQGVALTIEALAADDIAAGRLVAPFNTRLPLEEAYFLVTLEETAEVPRVAAFRNWILREAQQFRGEFPEPDTTSVPRHGSSAA